MDRISYFIIYSDSALKTDCSLITNLLYVLINPRGIFFSEVITAMDDDMSDKDKSRREYMHTYVTPRKKKVLRTYAERIAPDQPMHMCSPI